MLNEVISRIDLIISCQGNRRISLENLQFLFEKYELTPEEREQVLKTCEEKHIIVFKESKDSDLPTRTISGNAPGASDAAAKTAATEKPAKKGFFKRLFG